MLGVLGGVCARGPACESLVNLGDRLIPEQLCSSKLDIVLQISKHTLMRERRLPQGRRAVQEQVQNTVQSVAQAVVYQAHVLARLHVPAVVGRRRGPLRRLLDGSPKFPSPIHPRINTNILESWNAFFSVRGSATESSRLRRYLCASTRTNFGICSKGTPSGLVVLLCDDGRLPSLAFGGPAPAIVARGLSGDGQICGKQRHTTASK